MLTYRQALLGIFQRTDYERGERPSYPERVWRLSRVEELLSRLGDPQRLYRSVHIAGTKGKGSTTALVESVLRAAGYRTGMYTSPHLHTFRERIRLGGELISEDEVAAQVERLQPILAERPEVTVFEIITAIAMRSMADHGVEWGVFEVGMGGRLDATNILRPEVSVITSISLDHMKVLGNTLSAIAYEKAGIIKPGIATVSAPQRREARRVIVSACAERGAPLCQVGADWNWRLLRHGDGRQWLDIYSAGCEDAPEYPALELPLLGAHQLENACTAVAALETLRAQGHLIPRQAVRRGLAQVQWPGRFEILGRAPTVVVDGAHNVYSIERLLEAARDYMPHRRLIVVFGAGTTHNPGELMAPLLAAGAQMLVTQSHHPKASAASWLVDLAAELGYAVASHATVAQALEAAQAVAQEDDLILVTGSLFVVAEAREVWFAQRGLPALPSDPPGVY